jgi:hypothetical protein
MKLKEGDIFEFSINDNSKSYGQIISTQKKDALTVLVFEGLYRSRPQISELLEDKILFFGNTFDAKFFHKHWVVIENVKSNIEKIQLPYFKLGTDPIYIEDFFGKKIRKLKPHEEKFFFYRSYVAPVRFESALKAYYKVLEWNESYDELLYSNLLKGVHLLDNNG